MKSAATIVEVITTYPGGTTSVDRLRWSRPREEVLSTYRDIYRTGGIWEHETLTRHQCIHGVHRRDCTEVVSVTTFHSV